MKKNLLFLFILLTAPIGTVTCMEESNQLISQTKVDPFNFLKLHENMQIEVLSHVFIPAEEKEVDYHKTSLDRVNQHVHTTYKNLSLINKHFNKLLKNPTLNNWIFNYVHSFLTDRYTCDDFNNIEEIPPLEVALSNNAKFWIKKYFEHHPDQINQSIPQQTPLTWCASMSNTRAMLDLLINKCRANINAQDANKDTGLIVATKYDKTEAALWLLEHGADHTIKNAEGKTALDIAETLQPPFFSSLPPFKNFTIAQAIRKKMGT